MGTKVQERPRSRSRDKSGHHAVSPAVKEIQKKGERQKQKKESSEAREKLRIQTRNDSEKRSMGVTTVVSHTVAIPDAPDVPPSFIASITNTEGSQDSSKENSMAKENTETASEDTSKVINREMASCEYAVTSQISEKKEERRRREASKSREAVTTEKRKSDKSHGESNYHSTAMHSPKQKKINKKAHKILESQKTPSESKNEKNRTSDSSPEMQKGALMVTSNNDQLSSGDSHTKAKRTSPKPRSSLTPGSHSPESPQENIQGEAFAMSSTSSYEEKSCDDKQSPSTLLNKISDSLRSTDSEITGEFQGCRDIPSSSDSDQGVCAGIRHDADSLSFHLRQNSSSETNLVNNLTPDLKFFNEPMMASKKRGILKNKNVTAYCGSRLLTEEMPSESAAVNVDEGREPRLDKDMIILSEAFHLDENTQAMLAQYDARTVEDFCLMTPEDLDQLVQDAAFSNRPLPPLQIRKVQVLREWAHNLADQTMRQAELQALCSYATGIVSEQPADQYASLVPQDWAKQFREDLPRLKHMLKERGQRTAAAGVAWLGLNCLPFPFALTCGF